jgi:hypothetical protein
VPFSISLEYKFDVWLIPLDIISLIVFAMDILMTLKTAFNKHFEITVNLNEVSVDYMDTRFFVDILSMLPIDYLLLLFDVEQQTIAFVRALRLLKLYKPFDYIKTWRKHSNVRIALFTLFLLTFLFAIISHLMG